MKRQPKEFVKAIKERQEHERKNNFTFRFQKELVEKFRGECDKPDLSMTSVIEEMTQDFIGKA